MSERLDAPTDGAGSTLARTGEVPPERLEVAAVTHSPRRADIDPRAARRAERQVSIMFGLSAVLVVAFIAAYVAIDISSTVFIPGLGDVGAMNLALGLTFGGAIFLIGAGAVHWAKKLMPDVEIVAERHELGSDEATTDAALAAYKRGRDESGFAQRRIVRRSLLGALAFFPLPLVVLLRDLWTQAPGAPAPYVQLANTIWEPGERIVTDITYQPVKAEDIPVGGLVNVVPERLKEVEEAEGNLNARAKSAAILVRMTPEQIRSQQNPDWDYQGILAFSKICTHVGCPISLYEQRTHHLLCPCHQSTFDLADSGNVIFGPAARRMPQLAIDVDAEGYLIARGDFAEPVGPSFWERG